MTALRKIDLPIALRNEMARLKGAGFPLLPLGGGVDGKSPLTKSWASNLSLAQILGPMHRTGSRVYGIRLDGLAVIDCDTDNPALIAEMEARFGASPVHVRTPRGLHLYYRLFYQATVPNLRGEGLPVDIKSGPRAYVVGPGSERPDGGLYVPVRGLLGVDGLPALKAPGGPLSASGAISEGHRHKALVKEAKAMVGFVDSEAELFENLRAVRDDCCADPASLRDSELHGIAEWFWKRRLEGRLFSGRDSEFPIHRLSLDALRGHSASADAIVLLVIVSDLHGHAPGRQFPLDFVRMRAAGLIDLSIPRLRAARKLLEQVGLLRLVGKHRAGSRPQTFVLTRLRPGLVDAKNVVVLGAGEAGGRV